MERNESAWDNRWIGGFCALAATGGAPIRGSDYHSHPPLQQAMTLPPQTQRMAATQAEAQAAWSVALGGVPVVLVRSVAVARTALLRGATSTITGHNHQEKHTALLGGATTAGDVVGVPANATAALVGALTQQGVRPSFLDMDGDLTVCACPSLGAVRFVWAQPVGGLPARIHVPDAEVWVDHADTLPLPGHPWWNACGSRDQTPAVILFGLHLSSDPEQSGAVLAFRPDLATAGQESLSARVMAHIGADDAPDPSSALAQCRRLCGGTLTERGLATRQSAVLIETQRGVAAAAGLHVGSVACSGALAQHVAVQIPQESDASTFYAYVKAENTPVRWLPELRPVHPMAFRRDSGSDAHRIARQIARWLLVPVGPDDTSGEIAQAILGIVKASEYLGVRWRTSPQRAASYAQLMVEQYGPDHDAYRPSFSGPSGQPLECGRM